MNNTIFDLEETVHNLRRSFEMKLILKQETEFFLYPNFINQLWITDETGRVVLHQKINSKQLSLSIDNFQSGIYFLQIKTQSGKIMRRKWIVL